MIRQSTRAGLIVLPLLMPSAGLRAEKGSQPTVPPQSAPSCSGLGCIFGSGATAPESASRAGPQAAADVEGSPTGAPADESPALKKPVKRAPHPITIAATAPEAAKLKGLAAVLPKSKLVVGVATGQSADFVVTAKLDPSQRGQARLFTEEMHIVARGSVLSLADLKDKVVSFGPVDGPTRIAARKAFDALAIPVKETPLDLDNAFDGLSTGDIDAVVVLAPQPFTRLATLRTPGLHLLAWPDHAALPSGASDTAIAGDSYPHLATPGQSIRAVGVDAVLDMRASATRQPAARAFLASLAQHSAALSKRGFNLIKADLDNRAGRRVASADQR